MSTITIIVTVLAFLVLAILASLAMIFRKINRTRTSRQSLCFDSLPDIFSADASDYTSHYQPSTAILDTTTSHTLHTLEAISSDSSCPMLVEEEEIDDSHLSPHWQPADSVIERDYEAVEDLNEDDYAEEIKTSPSCLSDMGDEEALAWAHSFMLRFNAAAAVLAATPGYDLECDDEYEEDEYHHPVSPVLESIAEENEQLSDEEDEVPHGDDGNLSLEWNARSPNHSCSSGFNRYSWKAGDGCTRVSSTPRSVHHYLPVDSNTPPYVRPRSRLSFNSPLA